VLNEVGEKSKMTAFTGTEKDGKEDPTRKGERGKKVF